MDRFAYKLCNRYKRFGHLAVTSRSYLHAIKTAMHFLTFSLFVMTSLFVKESHSTGSNALEKGRERYLFIYLFDFHLSSQTKLMLRCVNVARMYLLGNYSFEV